jgi:hypothetical protein
MSRGRWTTVGVLGWLMLPAAPAWADEPGLQGRNDIVLQDGFEAADWYTAWGMSSAPRTRRW